MIAAVIPLIMMIAAVQPLIMLIAAVQSPDYDDCNCSFR
jgi:hypothetical protein